MCINVTFSFLVLSAKKKNLGFLLAGQGANISVEASVESWSC